MLEPTICGEPLSMVFFYFVFYSALGWAMETTYCSLVEKRFVVRGFLISPICPIYGAGALIMIYTLSRFMENLFLFYIIAVIVVSAWEYAVGVLLEAATHIKYWDYSRFRFQLGGKIALVVCLWWGVLAYFLLFWIHPFVTELFFRIPDLARQVSAGILLVVLAVDTATTIHKLAITTRLMKMLEELSGEIRRKLEGAPGTLDSAAELLRQRYTALLHRTERQSRRFLERYREMTSTMFSQRIAELREAGAQLKRRLRRTARQGRKNRKEQRREEKSESGGV